MSEYCVVYRCRLCGDYISCEPEAMTENEASKLLIHTIAADQLQDGPEGTKKMIGIHQCASGSIGIADFAGLRKERSYGNERQGT